MLSGKRYSVMREDSGAEGAETRGPAHQHSSEARTALVGQAAVAGDEDWLVERLPREAMHHATRRFRFDTATMPRSEIGPWQRRRLADVVAVLGCTITCLLSPVVLVAVRALLRSTLDVNVGAPVGKDEPSSNATEACRVLARQMRAFLELFSILVAVLIVLHAFIFGMLRAWRLCEHTRAILAMRMAIMASWLVAFFVVFAAGSSVTRYRSAGCDRNTFQYKAGISAVVVTLLALPCLLCATCFGWLVVATEISRAERIFTRASLLAPEPAA